MGVTTVRVGAERPYDVHIGRGAAALAPELLRGAARVALIHPPVMAGRVEALTDQLRGADPELRVLPIVVPAGEDAKTSEVLVHCWNELAGAGFTRSDLVIGLGGGSTTDLAGFVAASFLRGIDVVSVPSTVLAMVDAAVGGKTGINIPAGKNLVGAFWEPRAVLCDLDLLVGLPQAEVASGLAEVVKAGFTSDLAILDLAAADPAQARDVRSDRFADLVHRGIAYKAAVVSRDLREATSTASAIGREALNYGHTLAHAIEAHHHFTWRHGDAVSVGMVFAAEVSRRMVGLSATDVQRHRELLGALGLPVSYRGREHGGDRDQASFDELRAIMARDKKARGSRLRMIGLDAIGHVTLLEDPDDDLLRDAFAALS